MTVWVDPARLSRIVVLEQDEDRVVIGKPAGLPVHGGVGTTKTVVDLVSKAAGGERMHLVHRLDKATSGVLVIAKNAAAAAALGKVWEQTEKVYLAIVHGTGIGPSMITAPLSEGERGALAARTEVEAVWPLDGLDATLLRVRLWTGRTHQIRRHLAAEGYPVAMDDKHGNFAQNKQLKKRAGALGASLSKKAQLLHALSLTVEGQRFSAPIPDRWTKLLTAVAPEVPLEAVTAH